MNDDHDDRAATGDAGQRRCPRFGFSRRTRIGIAAAALLGIGAALGALAGLSASAGAHVFAGHAVDAAEEIERARDRLAWVLGKLDASDEQEAQVDAIVGALIADVAPLREQHREHRRAFVAALLRSDVDRARLEAIRREEIELADAASVRIVDAVAQAAAVLTPEQRAQLLDWASSHRARH